MPIANAYLSVILFRVGVGGKDNNRGWQWRMQVGLEFVVGISRSTFCCIYGSSPSIGWACRVSSFEAGLFPNAQFATVCQILRPSSAATRLPSLDLKLNYVFVCALCVQDGSVLKMIVDWASLDTGLGARALAQVIEFEIAELEQEEEWEGRQRTRASSRGKAAASPLPTPRPRAARRRKISVRRPDTP